MKRVLLVFSEQDGELLEALFKHIEQRCDDITATKASTATRALLLLREDSKYDHVVVGASLANDQESIVETAGGLSLCIAIRAVSTVELILVLPTPNGDIELACSSMNPRPFITYSSALLSENIVRALRNFDVPKKRLDVVISAKQGSVWRYRLNGVNFKYERFGDLKIGDAGVFACTIMSKSLDESLRRENWFGSFTELGKFLILRFCENEEFQMHLRAGLEQVENVSNTRILFEVERDHTMVTLEAVLLPSGHQPFDEPWMLHAPLSRNIPIESNLLQPLFDGPRHRLRCLILCADTHGTASGAVEPDGSPIELGILKHVVREVEDVRRLFENPPAGVVVDRPVVLGLSPGEPLSKSAIINELKSGDWDVVHFAGHSYFKYEKNLEERAYLFVGPPDKPEAVSLAELAAYLRRSRLLYLSSCESGNASFIAAAARAGIPAAIGFRWPVHDGQAADYAKLFYSALLATKSIDSAFLEARRELYKSAPNDPTWASATLVTSGKTRAA